MLRDIVINNGTHSFTCTGPDLRYGPLIEIRENIENGQNITIPISALEHILKCIDPDTGHGKYDELIDDTIVDCMKSKEINNNPFLALALNIAVSELVYSLIDVKDKDGKYPYENIKEIVLQLATSEDVIKANLIKLKLGMLDSLIEDAEKIKSNLRHDETITS